MDNDLHKTDDLFHKAYLQFEDDPSPAAWEGIKTILDKKDAEKYKKRFIGWKRIAILLLVLLSVLILYEFMFTIKNGGVNQQTVAANNKNSVNPQVKKENSDAVVGINGNNEKDQATHDGDNNTSDQPARKMKELNKSQINSLKENHLTDHINKSTGFEPDKRVNGTNSSQGKPLHPGDFVSQNTSPAHYSGNNKLKGYGQQNSGALIEVKAGVKENADELMDTRAAIILSPSIDPTNNIVIKDKPQVPGGRLASTPLFLNSMKLPATHNRRYWSLAAFVSNDWGMYLLNDDVLDHNGTQHDERNEITNKEKHEASISAGLYITREFTNHFRMKSGLIYSNTAIGIDTRYLYASPKPDGAIAYKYNTSSGYGFVKPDFGIPPAIGDSLQSTEAQHNLQSLGIVLMPGYKFGRNNFSVTTSAGISANFITRATLRTEVIDALHRESITINRLYGTRVFYTSFMADVNLEYKFSQRWSMNILPAFKFALTPITKNNVVKTYPYSFGIGAGVSYTL